MYDFRTLSPLDFEDLVRDLLQAEMNLRMESFGPGPDLGIDFRFATAENRAIVQAKHMVDSRSEALIRILRREDSKVAKLSPGRYLLATSLSLTPALKTRIRDAMPHAPLADADIIGKADLINLLGRHPKIELKHFKLWLTSTAVLERILHSGVYNRTQAEMNAIRAIVPKFVPNESVPAAEAILDRSGTLIISGLPGVGKTTLARMLVWLHAEQGWRISIIDDIKEAFEIQTEGHKSLIFFDDFLGQVRLSNEHVRGMDQRLPPFLQKVRSNKAIRFILTTRDYILRQAQAYSSRLSAPAVNTSELILNVGNYTRASKARMLYNHLYFSEISTDERNSLLKDDYFLKIIDHSNFNPRLIDLLTSSDYLTISAQPIRKVVESVLANPQELWEIPYKSHISEEGRALMLAVFFNDTSTEIHVLQRSFERMVEAMGYEIPTADRPRRFRAALKELEGSVLAILNRTVQYSNPGVRDFLEQEISRDRFLPTAIRTVTEYAEVMQCWAVFRAQTPEPFLSQNCADDWAAAFERLCSSGTGTPLQRLSLVFDMYHYLNDEILLRCIRAASTELETADLDGTETSLCTEILETLALSIVPTEELDEAKRVVSFAIAKMLADYGFALTLEEIEAVASRLYKYGIDESQADEAARSALMGYIEELPSTLSELRSVDELEDWLGEFRRLTDEYGVFDRAAERHIENRREALEERSEYDEGYGGRSHPSSPAQASDDDIRSIFSGLRDA